MIALAPVHAFDDRDFCVAARQLALAAEGDIGVWTDRVTRNAGMVVSCERKVIEFKRFTYTPSASMNDAWKERQAAEWKASRCASPIWTQAIRNDWKIILSVTAFDGRQVSLNAQCK